MWRGVCGLGLLGILAVAAPLRAQSYQITGVVRDSITNETVPNAFLQIPELEYRALTDEFGRFGFIGLGPESITLRVEQLGYEVLERTLGAPDQAGPLELFLIPDAIEVGGVTVRVNRQLVQVATEISQVSIAPAEIATLPTIGEADLFRSAQLLPGVSGTNDATSGLFVRGGTPDENLVLLDGITVYHVDHFFGVFSAFNSDAIKDMRLLKGGFPAQYGGRTSSVVELIGKSGDDERFRARGGLNLLSARTVLETPLPWGGSWLLSARRSYTDIVQSGVYDNLFGTLQGADTTSATATQGPGGGPGGGRGFGRFRQQQLSPSFYFFDVNSRVTLTPTDRDVLSFSVYGGQDNLDQSTDPTSAAGFGGLGGADVTIPGRLKLTDWGNNGASGRWSRQWGSRFTSDVLGAYSRYFSNSERGIRGGATGGTLGPVGGAGFLEENLVEDLTLRLDNSFRMGPRSTLAFGGQVTRNDASYDFVRLTSDTIQGSLGLGGQARTTSGYIQDLVRPVDGLDVTFGVRTTHYDGSGQVYWEPRASAQYQVTPQLRVKGAWGKYNQFIKRVENEDVLEGSRDFWVLTDSVLTPSSAEHRIAGISYETAGYLFDVEAYDKVLDGVTQFSTRSRRLPGQALTELFFSGNGTARGVEVLAQKKTGRLTGWLAYTLGKVEYDLEGFNSDLPFPASHDQTHEFKSVASYQLGPWTFSGTWVFGSGRAYTVPESTYTLELLDGTEFSYIHVGGKNAERLPAYHRLDIAASRRFETETMFYEVNLSVFNAYGNDNVWYRQFDLTEAPVLVTDITTLPFTPSIGLSFGLK